jgi:hypothetical protein
VSDWICCPVTRRRWPAVKRTELLACRLCGGLIDLRVEAYLDGPGPMHLSGGCPERVPEPAPPTPVAQAPAVPRMSGREMLDAIDSRRDRVHEAALNRTRLNGHHRPTGGAS